MKKQLHIVAFGAILLGGNWLSAQNVGIGTNTPLEKLHVVGGNLRVNNLAGVGVRIVGSDANGTLTIVAPGTNGQVLTQTGAGPAWQAITAWQTVGNAGTVPATNFIGTTDNVDFVTRTNNTEAMRVTLGQRVGIGTTTPTVKLDVLSGAGDAIYGHSTNVGAYLGYETNFIVGSAGAIQGAGIWASNPAAGYTSLYSQSSGAATVAANINFSSVWIASYNLVDNGTATFNPPALYAQLNVTNATMGSLADKIAVRGYNNRGTTAGNPGYSVGVEGVADSQNEDAFGVQGLAFCNNTVRAGGYFESYTYAGASQAFAYVGSTAGLPRKITGTNAVSEIIPTANHGRITMTAPESPEYWYQDYGTITLVNGRAHVDLDPILVDITVIDAANPIRVFCTPVEMPAFNGVTVMNQDATGFDLVELNGGTHSGRVDYQLVVRPKTGYGEGRFPQAPGPAYLKASMEPAAAKAANQPNLANIFYWPSDHEVYGYNPDDMTGVGGMVHAGPNIGKTKMPNGTFVKGTGMEQPKGN